MGWIKTVRLDKEVHHCDTPFLFNEKRIDNGSIWRCDDCKKLWGVWCGQWLLLPPGTTEFTYAYKKNFYDKLVQQIEADGSFTGDFEVRT